MLKEYLFAVVVLPFLVVVGLWYARRRFEVRTLENQVARKRHTDPSAEALAILNQRLARGEISPDEYHRLRKLMEK
ncbi:MAG TPA: SHOCT domain-containing protein [Aggregatilineales bacterium]|nr:SHOCT domain-containing protein [Aggregatilineales bacterium]